MVSVRTRAYLYIGVGLLVAIWFGFGLPPTGGPALQISSGGNDTAVGVALPYLALAIAGLVAAVWGVGILLRPWLMR